VYWHNTPRKDCAVYMQPVASTVAVITLFYVSVLQQCCCNCTEYLLLYLPSSCSRCFFIPRTSEGQYL